MHCLPSSWSILWVEWRRRKAEEGGGRLQEAFIRAFLNENIIFRFLDFITSLQSLFFLCNFFSSHSLCDPSGATFGNKVRLQNIWFCQIEHPADISGFCSVCVSLAAANYYNITVMRLSWELLWSHVLHKHRHLKAKKEQKRRKEVCKVDY